MKQKLSDIYELQMGKTPARKEPTYWNGSNMWVSISDLSSNGKFIKTTKEGITDEGVKASGIKSVPKGTLMMSFKLSLGKVAISDCNLYTNEAIMSFIDKGKYAVDRDYMYYQLQAIDWSRYTNKAVKGATLNKATLSDVIVKIPSLDEQKYVVEKLDKTDRLIANLNKQNELIAESVKSRFVEMFGDRKNPLFPVSTIGDECILKSGTTLPSDVECEEGEIPYIKVSDMNLPQNDTYINISTRYVSRADAGKTFIQKGSVVFPKRGAAIATNKKRILVHDTCCDLNIMGVFPQENLRTSYLYNYFCNMDLGSLYNGSTVPQINNKDIAPLKIGIPPMGLQLEFEQFFQRIDKSKLTIQKSMDNLMELRNSLLQEYFS